MIFQVGMENGDYLSVFCHVLLPVAYEVSIPKINFFLPKGR